MSRWYTLLSRMFFFCSHSRLLSYFELLWKLRRIKSVKISRNFLYYISYFSYLQSLLEISKTLFSHLGEYLLPAIADRFCFCFFRLSFFFPFLFTCVSFSPTRFFLHLLLYLTRTAQLFADDVLTFCLSSNEWPKSIRFHNSSFLSYLSYTFLYSYSS